jgi:acetoin utilization deacetylase AcuC-like enzyme
MSVSRLAQRALGRLAPRASVPVWYHPDYRLPLSRYEPRTGIEVRRADLVAWFLEARRVLAPAAWRTPTRASYSDLARVHTPEWLESLSEPATLARLFAVLPEEVAVGSMLASIRLAVGGTIAAAREALERRGPTVNLLGGFHHAFPGRGGGFCAVNDIAVAVAALRAEGFIGRVCVLDLDAHPPDGTAACLAADPSAWVGSLSAAEWDDLPEHVDETVLPAGSGDATYLHALHSLLARMPRPQLAFVLAGGDVLDGDALGRLGLTLAGARERDLIVRRALGPVASVWMPAGGYHADSWKVLAGTVLALSGRGRAPILDDVDPMDERFTSVSKRLAPDRLRGASAARASASDWNLSPEDVDDILGVQRPGEHRLLGYYTAAGLEYALHAFGLLAHLERLGYGELHAIVDDAASGGDRARLFGSAAGEEHLLMECALEKRWLPAPVDAEVLYVHWLTLRDPRARFRGGRVALPGQEVPGLGLARECTLMLERMAHRLGLAAVAYRPAWFHTAYPTKDLGRFADPARQGRFEAMLRDLDAAGLSFAESSRAIAEGRVHLDGAAYEWEPDVMLRWLVPPPTDDAAEVAAAREQAHFVITAVPSPSPPAPTDPHG